MKQLKTILFVVTLLAATAHLHARPVRNRLDAILALGTEMSNVRAMLENYTIIGAKITFKNPKRRLKENIASHDALMETLKKGFEDPKIQQLVTEGLTAWAPVKKALLTAQNGADRAQMRQKAQFVHDHIRTVIKNLAAMKNVFLTQAKIAHPEALNAPSRSPPPPAASPPTT